MSALLYAVGEQSIDKVRDALAQGTTLEQRNEAFLTATFHLGNEAIALLLLDAGIDVHAKDSSGRTPMHGAANRGLEAVAMRLVAMGATLDQPDSFTGDTPMLCAGSYGTPGIIKLLLDAGIPVDTQNSWGVTALHNAAMDGNVGVAKVLLQAGANLALSTRRAGHYVCGTPLHFAMSYQRRDTGLIQLLIDHGASTTAFNEDGWAPIHVAGSVHDASWALEALLKAGADPDLRDKKGWTALHHGAKRQSFRCVEVLLKAGADPEIQLPRTDKRPLHLAAEAARPEVAGLLLKHGVSRTAKTRDGLTAMDIARAKKRTKTLALLSR